MESEFSGEQISGTYGESELSRISRRLEEINDLNDLTPEEVINESRILIRELIDHLQTDLNLELSFDVNSLYAEMGRENLLARVENVTSVINCIEMGTPITVGSTERHYANSVVANIEGLRVAMSEADALGPRLLVGLDLKALIGFTNDHLSVSEIDENEFDLRNSALRSAHCRHVNGEIRAEDIKYMVMRIPRTMFPEESLTEKEMNLRTGFVFRGAKISTKGETGEIPMANAA